MIFPKGLLGSCCIKERGNLVVSSFSWEKETFVVLDRFYQETLKHLHINGLDEMKTSALFDKFLPWISSPLILVSFCRQSNLSWIKGMLEYRSLLRLLLLAVLCMQLIIAFTWLKLAQALVKECLQELADLGRLLDSLRLVWAVTLRMQEASCHSQLWSWCRCSWDVPCPLRE